MTTNTSSTCESDRERAQTGLGTLVVFLSMILIAAMAAGVLVDAGSHVQSHADAAGEESTQQVADRIHVLTEIGYTDESADDFDHTNLEHVSETELHRLELLVQPGPGTEVIDFEDVTIEFLGGEVETLTHVAIDEYDGTDIAEAGALEDGDEQFFAMRTLEGEAGANVLAREDRGVIVIPLGEYDEETEWVAAGATVDQPDRLEAGDTAQLTITTAQGSQTLVELVVPDPLADEPAVSL